MMRDREEMMISDEIKRLVPVLGKTTATRLSKAYLLGDETTRKRIIELVDIVKAGVFSDDELRETVLLQPPAKSIATAGEIEFGQVLYGKKRLYPMKIDSSMLLTHVGIFGSSGYGKTNLSYWLVKQLAEKGVPVLIFDFSKKNYRELLQTDLKDKIDIFTIGKDIAPFKFNPLQPPEGVQLSQWIKEFSSIFDHAYWLLGGGRHIILRGLNSVFTEKKSPVLSDLKSWLMDQGAERLAARERNWLSTATRPLESLCFKELGEVFKCQAGIVPSEFFAPGRITILELDALDTNDKTFFIEITLQWIRDWLLSRSQREKLAGVIILEEAHHVLNREKANKMGSETVIELVFREIRELGMGVIYIDQHPSLVSYPALGNTSTHIYMNLGLDTRRSSDVQDAAGMLGLKEEEADYLRKLSVGHGFMLCRRSGFTDPFLMEFPLVDVKKGSVTDDVVKKHMKGKVEALAKEAQEEKEDLPVQFSGELDEHEQIIVKAIASGEGAFTSQIYQATKMSGTTFKKKAQQLVDKDILGVRKAKKGKNRLYCYFFTPQAKELANKFAPKGSEKALPEVLGMLSQSGWTYESEGNKIVFEDGQNRQEIMVLTEPDRDALESCQTNHFICGNERLKNLAIQYAALRVWKTGRLEPIFVATARKFAEKGKFERIEFPA
ncbi:MAG: ATP-binding protein [Candidatus Aenigmatarchaeota archaeon]